MGEERELTNRAKKALATKKRIVSEGRKLIAKKGYDNVSVEEICKSADITVGTFYYYFKSKEDIIIGLLPTIDNFYKEYQYDESVSSIQKAVDYFSYFNREVEKSVDSEIVLKLFSCVPTLSALDVDRILPGIQLIMEGQIKGEITNDANAADMAKIIFAATRGLTLHWAMHDNSIKLGAATEELVSRIMQSYMIAPEKN